MRRRDITIALGALLLGLAAAVGIFRGSVLETGSWGLSFRQEGAPPIGTAGKDQLARYDAAYIGNTGEKVLYLTFDAGYENGFTAQMLDVLKDRQVPAAFFLVGDYLEREPDLVRQMVSGGHIVGNHPRNHPDMSKLDDAAFVEELQGMERLYEEVTGQTLPRFYRPPQGLYSEENLKITTPEDLKIFKALLKLR